MDKYKLYNTIKRELLKRPNIKKSDIQLKGFSYGLLGELFQKYAVSEYVVSEYCCRGEDHCCWQEVAGGLSKPFEIEKSLYSSLKRHQKELYDRKIFYVETKKMIWVQIPLRDIAQEDYSIIFDKTKSVKDLQDNKR